MLLIHCPYCEEDRPELEFRHAGQAHIARPSNMADVSDEAFQDYYFTRANPKGLIYERWRHAHGCARFFNAVRNTVSDQFLVTYKAGEKRPVLGKAKAPVRKTAQPTAKKPTSRAKAGSAKKR